MTRREATGWNTNLLVFPVSMVAARKVEERRGGLFRLAARVLVIVDFALGLEREVGRRRVMVKVKAQTCDASQPF